MTSEELVAVPGVAESRLEPTVASGLPDEAPAAPWDCAGAGIVWLARGGQAALEAAGPAVAKGRHPALMVGGVITYARTPVGGYSEVFAGVALRRGADLAVSIPFMAVDSPVSVVGGRQNWSLPKVLARFSGTPSARSASGRTTMTAEGDGWRVRVTARPSALRLPVRTTGLVVQEWPDGVVRSARLTGRARCRPAVVSVEIDSRDGLGRWLRTGRHLGAVLTDARFTLSAAG
jgi:hypothetical protein